jgi:radical SAM protein with 4Fe4S-binding SPASM domain
MKFIAVLEADFERGPLGTRSRLRDDLLGETVLRRTLKRVLECPRLASIHLVVEAAQEALAREVVAGLPVKVETHSAGPPPWQSFVASARKWSLDAWRGGIAGMTVFDEAINPWVLEILARRESADAVACIPAAAVMFDPHLLGEMLAHYEQVHADVRLTFTQSPPGLTAGIFATGFLADLAKAVQPPGRTMTYRPSEPQRDSTLQPCYYSVPPAIAQSTGRLIVDTGAALARVQALLEKGDESNFISRGDAVGCARGEKYAVPVLPGEVEIELTTEESLPATTLRPRGQAVGQRGPIDADLFGRLVSELAQRDDARVVLGGYGDPLLHPDFPGLLRRCRAAGIFALAVRTPAVTLDESLLEILIENQVDVLNVLLDATTAASYAQVHGADHFDRVVANIEAVLAAHKRTKQPRPLVVCELVKTRATIHEMEAFYDHWLNKTSAAVIAGPSNHAGRWADLGVMNMSPSARFACSRIFSRTMVMADGRVTVCDQDFRGEFAIGSLADRTLSDLWTGSAMQAVRRAEQAGVHNGMAMCPACQEWHRP